MVRNDAFTIRARNVSQALRVSCTHSLNFSLAAKSPHKFFSVLTIIYRIVIKVKSVIRKNFHIA